MKRIANEAAFALARDLLREGRTVSLRVEGESMLPFFRGGSVIRLRPLAAGDLRRGHVVLAETDGGKFVVHRILHVGAERITLSGDGNCMGTESVARDRVHGTVDCGRVHLALARLWLHLRPVRKYPLWFVRRICRR